MGTFHDNLGELHGHTVVLSLTSGGIVVGRCHELREDRADLVGADIFEKTPDGPTRDEYLERISRFGHWEKHPRLSVPMEDVEWVRPLREIAAE